MVNLKMQIRRQLPALLLATVLSFSGQAAGNNGVLAEYNYYETGKIELNAGNYRQAIDHFAELQKRYPNSPYIPQAQLERAYAHYKLKEADAAVDLLQGFFDSENRHPHKPYAFYLSGLAKYQEALELIEQVSSPAEEGRARAVTQQAIDYFGQLVEQFPGSQYSEDSRKKTTYLLEKLVMHRIKLEKLNSSRSRLKQIQVESDQAIVWLLKQPSDQYTLQLIRSPDYDTVFMISLQYKLEDEAIIIETEESDGKKLFTLFYGVYPSRGEALLAGSNLPSAIIEAQPVVRELSTVQAEVAGRVKMDTPESPASEPSPDGSDGADAAASQTTPASNIEIPTELWLMSQNPMAYTVHVMGSASERAIVAFINEHNLADQTTYYRSIRRDGSSWYSLLYGSYIEKSAAIEAAQQLGVTLGIEQPWIKRFQSVQNEIESSKPR